MYRIARNDNPKPMTCRCQIMAWHPKNPATPQVGKCWRPKDRSTMPRVFFLRPIGIPLPSPTPQMSRHIHGLMQDADHEDHGAIDLVERKMAACDQSPASRQEIRTVRSDPRIVDQPRQGMLDVVEISVRLVRSPLTVGFHPNVDEICSRGFTEPDLTRHWRQTWPAPRV